MKAVINKNDIIICNSERRPEDIVFKNITKAFEENNNVQIKNKIIGPSEDVVIAECNGMEVVLVHDIDYGISPIKCAENNINVIFDIVKNVLNE